MSQYVIKSGDTFSAIAKANGISVAALEAANPGVNPDNLQVGQKINIPGGSGPTTTPYVIKSGDTFSAIAKANGITVAALEAANPGVNPDNLQVGQTINIPGGSGSTTTPYVIKSGDTFSAIAKANGITVAALEAANPGVNPDNLKVGQTINIPSSSSNGGGSTGSGGSNGGGSTGSGGSNGSTGPGKGTEVGQGYHNYSGPASNFPDPADWAPFDTLVTQNKRLMAFHDTDAIINLIISSVQTVSAESGISPQAILCTIMQESGGDPTVSATNNGVRNPGLMQSHNGVEFDPSDPAGSILQMIRDGTEGTKDGDGLKQLFAQYGNYYEAFRGYNSGAVNQNDLNDPVGATASYVDDMANRLMGHIWDGM